MSAHTRWSRRTFLRSVAGGAIALPFAGLVAGRPAAAMDGGARRLVVFYFPDGVPGVSGSGQASLWNPTGGRFDFALPELLAPLDPWRDRCVFTSGLSMGATDEGSHPGGAKKLLTAVDGGYGESVDQVLARTVGGPATPPHLPGRPVQRERRLRRQTHLLCRARRLDAAGRQPGRGLRTPLHRRERHRPRRDGPAL